MLSPTGTLYATSHVDQGVIEDPASENCFWCVVTWIWKAVTQGTFRKRQMLNNDMLDLLVNFCARKIAVTADVPKAFVQICIMEDDWGALRFLWFKDMLNKEWKMPKIQELEITRAPFGTMVSPFLLTATLLHHFWQMKDSYPVTAQRLEKCFYVNNLVTGGGTAEEYYRFYDETNTILVAAEIKLQKRMTTLPDLQKHMRDDHPKVSTSRKCSKVFVLLLALRMTFSVQTSLHLSNSWRSPSAPRELCFRCHREYSTHFASRSCFKSFWSEA